MTPAELTSWRQRMGLTKGQAAESLGLSPNGYAAYERGWVHGLPPERGRHNTRCPRPIPKHVELACCELERRAAENKSQPVSIIA
jgi:hypothetical protein